MKRNIVAQSNNFTKKHLINSKNGVAIQTIAGEIEISSAACLETEDEEGVKNVSVLIATDGTCYTGISASAYQSTLDIIDLLDEENSPLKIRVESRTAKSGREFVAITVL